MTAAARSGTRGRPSLRLLVAVLLGVLGLLVAVLSVVAAVQLHAAHAEARAETRRTTSLLIADSMQQSSNDLTNMVRLYVSTGDPQYRGYYNQILSIRAGTSPRPVNYDSTFWDRVLDQGTGFIRYGKPDSLTAQMHAAQFTPAEFAALAASLRASNGLAGVEERVMNAVAPRIARGAGAGYLGAVAPEYHQLVDRSYLAQKGVIMAAVQRFIGVVDRLTARSVSRADARSRHLVAAEIAVLVLIVIVGLAALVVLSRAALRPLRRLTAATRRISDGDYSHRVRINAVAELEEVAGAFNEMGGAIETDIAAREQAEQEAVVARQVAEHASRAKTTFLAAMSHEIRTPMIGVTGMLEVLERTELTSQQRQMVATAESSAQALLLIIGDILDFSKIEADKLELAPRTFAIRPLLRTTVETFVHTASAKGLLLSWTADERIAPAQVGDALRLRQILSNFISNAVKFTDAGGIEVTARVTDASTETQTLEFAVTDTGVGVTPEQQARLFQEFAQAQASTSSSHGGTGLGLVICKRLAVLMGGDVTMESVAGSGTTVRLTVPLPIGDPADVEDAGGPVSGALPTSRPMPTREQARREGSLLLFAEDHPVNRTVLGHQLAAIGFHVDMAPDGEAGYEAYLSGQYGLVLTDLNMPRMDGYELAAAIRGHEAQTGAPRTPIVALSANVMQGEPERCRDAGMDDFAAKPTTIPFLAGKLHRWLPQLDWPAAEKPPSAPSALPSPELGAAIDAAALSTLTGGDGELAMLLLRDFVTASQEDLGALEQALGERRLEPARREAHRLKGAARTVGAREIVELAAEIESGCEDGARDWARYAELLSRLEMALESVADAVHA